MLPENEIDLRWCDCSGRKCPDCQSRNISLLLLPGTRCGPRRCGSAGRPISACQNRIAGLRRMAITPSPSIEKGVADSGSCAHSSPTDAGEEPKNREADKHFDHCWLMERTKCVELLCRREKV